MASENRIIRRKYYAADVTLLSPLSVSSGLNETTDADVLVNGNGEIFIPGTSLAGAMRNSLGLTKSDKGIFGYSAGKKGEMSSLFISDLYFHRKPAVSVRDGVQLTDDKNVENKFDMEIVETGECGTIYLNYVVRENDREKDFEEGISRILQGIQSGEIRFGAHKNRGFGRLKIETVYQTSFDVRDGLNSQTVQDWTEFVRNCSDAESSHKPRTAYYDKKESYDVWMEQHNAIQSKYIKITVPLKLKGGISIRKYSTQPNKADYEHITCNGKPVIPGTSWNGAIRSDIRDILTELGCSQEVVQKTLGKWFGKVSPKESEQSVVVFGESIIEDAERLPMTRNQINRFDGSVNGTALYSDISFYGGRTELEIMVRKDEEKAYQALLGILMLVIDDIREGFVAVGGLTAVGRGIFAEDADREITYSEPVNEETCREALYTLV